MSIRAICKMAEQDEMAVSYKYIVFDLKHGGDIINMKFDGKIKIDLSTLAEPNVEEKTLLTANGEDRKVRKRIHKNVDIEALVKNNMIQIRMCKVDAESGSSGVPRAAQGLCKRIYEIYQDEGSLPESIEIQC